ncbi:hypothetical protein NDU88_000913 [Pleurodeles waltl]|uniref:Uncharacterized protein n=1 Tax=Pleurodeles waltl TaxID=8319 RepID=A0AAV7KS32_PLEWA|nr:hypothetical protein NDU88_000913 [Pleurodeles waltl]
MRKEPVTWAGWGGRRTEARSRGEKSRERRRAKQSEREAGGRKHETPAGPGGRGERGRRGEAAGEWGAGTHEGERRKPRVESGLMDRGPRANTGGGYCLIT